MNNKLIYIYVLWFLGEALYVGQTKNIKRRLSEHKCKFKNHHIEIGLLEEVNELSANNRETYWILYFKDRGQCRLNKNYFGSVTRSKKSVQCIETNIIHQSLSKACSDIGILFSSARKGLIDKGCVKLQSFIDGKEYSIKYL